MEKKNLQPQQQKPVVRPTVAKPIAGLSEEQLTAGWTGASGEISPADNCYSNYDIGLWKGL